MEKIKDAEEARVLIAAMLKRIDIVWQCLHQCTPIEDVFRMYDVSKMPFEPVSEDEDFDLNQLLIRGFRKGAKDVMLGRGFRVYAKLRLLAHMEQDKVREFEEFLKTHGPRYAIVYQGHDAMIGSYVLASIEALVKNLESEGESACWNPLGDIVLEKIQQEFEYQAREFANTSSANELSNVAARCSLKGAYNLRREMASFETT